MTTPIEKISIFTSDERFEGAIGESPETPTLYRHKDDG
jgi:hypothetical protein